MKYITLLFVAMIFALTGCGKKNEKRILRVGFFPNVTHAQALIAQRMTAEGRDWFKPRLGKNIEIQWFSYNAGPSAMEAFFTSAIDLTYVGPNPALNAYIRSSGKEVRLISNAAIGGAALVVHNDDQIKSPKDFFGKKIATPQFGNTQDVACRAWLKKEGFNVTQSGGDCHVIPTANADQLSLFKSGEIDAAWTVEPWVSRLLLEANGKIFLEQNDAITTILVARTAFLEKDPELVQAFTKAHRELTEWINQNSQEAQRLLVEQLSSVTQGKISPKLISEAWKRIIFDSQTQPQAFEKFVQDAQSVGFLQEVVDLSNFFAISSP